MADSHFYQLLEAVETNIKASPDIDATKVSLGRSEVLPADLLPHVCIYLADDVTVGAQGAENNVYLDFNVGVMVEIMTVGVSAADLQKQYLDIRTYVHKSLMTDETQGKNFVLFTVPEGAEQPTLTGDAKQKSAGYKLSFIFRIRTSVTDLSTLVIPS